jgi:hypothetical protein
VDIGHRVLAGDEALLTDCDVLDLRHDRRDGLRSQAELSRLDL